jgi:hypothetical protein
MLVTELPTSRGLQEADAIFAEEVAGEGVADSRAMGRSMAFHLHPQERSLEALEDFPWGPRDQCLVEGLALSIRSGQFFYESDVPLRHFQEHGRTEPEFLVEHVAIRDHTGEEDADDIRGNFRFLAKLSTWRGRWSIRRVYPNALFRSPAPNRLSSPFHIVIPVTQRMSTPSVS